MFREGRKELKGREYPHRILAKFIENSLSTRLLLNTLNAFSNLVFITAL